MERPRAWVLNLDAEDELARPSGATLSRTHRAVLDAHCDTLTKLLLPGDVLIDEAKVTVLPSGAYEGRAWCPTPRALRVLKAARAIVPGAPSREVLREANHRALCAQLGQTLPGAQWVTTHEEAAAVVAQHGETGWWLLKRPLGYAGRGRLRVAAGLLDTLAVRWLKASLREGDGVQIEPWVERDGDYGLHGWVARDGAVVLGEPTVQSIDAQGAWRTSQRAAPDDLHDGEGHSLQHAADEAAGALHAIGYWGPFGVDAFRWRDARGLDRWNPRCEVNARYSMGWAVGMGDRRPDR